MWEVWGIFLSIRTEIPGEVPKSLSWTSRSSNETQTEPFSEILGGVGVSVLGDLSQYRA